MTDEETPDSPENENDPVAEALLASMMSSGSPMTRADGVGALLEQTAEFVEGRHFARIGTINGPEGAIPVVLKPGGGYEPVPLKLFDEYSDAPQFRRGTARMTSLDSFIHHLNRFGDQDSAVFANDSRTSPSLTAVLDYHRTDTLNGEEQPRVHGDYRHGRHRTEFAFPLSEEWKAWIESDGTAMSMVEFALFLENRIGDIALVEDAVPESAQRFVEVNGGPQRIADYGKLVELATGLRINEDSVVEEAVTLSSGEGRLRLSNEHTAQVGQSTITVPTMFFIAIPVFRNGVFYRLPARLRYRKTPTGLKFWYDLWRSDKAFDDAFGEAVARVDTETEAQVFYGTPEA